MPSLNPKEFKKEPLCEKSFEEALEIGKAMSGQLEPTDFKETSIRFSIDGLYKWYRSYAKQHSTLSVFTMFRDISWYWSSYCISNSVMSRLVKEYYLLLKDITEQTSFTDLADRMDEAVRVKEMGKRSYPFSLSVPMEPHGIILDCATALGMSFSAFYQVGVGRALSANSKGLYTAWIGHCFQPLFDEVMTVAERRLGTFDEIRETVDYRIRLGIKRQTKNIL